jgi:deoxycytidylate deaminase
MKTPLQAVIDTAIEAAKRSTCRKSQRGVVIFRPASSLLPKYRGCNHPPPPFTCDGSAACREHCNKLCVHAEVDALKEFRCYDRSGWWDLLHAKVVDGTIVPSGPPSCWQCSREIVDDDSITHVWLLHEDGWRRYSTVEFHKLTLQHHGLPVIGG